MDSRKVTPEMRAWIDQSQGLVRAIATKIISRLPAHVNFDDLISYGQLGLMQAAHSFDSNKNVAFQTFAYHRIRGAIYDGLGKMSWTNRAVAQRIRAEKLSAELLDQQVEASAANDASLSADADWLIQTTTRVAMVHLLTDTSGTEGNSTLSVASDAPQPEEVVEQRELCQQVRSLVGDLDRVEQQLIQAIYFEGKSISDAALELGKSKSWASRRHSRILETLALRMASSEIQSKPDC